MESRSVTTNLLPGYQTLSSCLVQDIKRSPTVTDVVDKRPGTKSCQVLETFGAVGRLQKGLNPTRHQRKSSEVPK